MANKTQARRRRRPAELKDGTLLHVVYWFDTTNGDFGMRSVNIQGTFLDLGAADRITAVTEWITNNVPLEEGDTYKNVTPVNCWPMLGMLPKTEEGTTNV